MARYRRKFWFSLAALTIALAAAVPARAQDKVTVGVFPVSSSLPYFVALDRGFFKEQNIAPEMVKLMGGPPNIAAMMTNQIEASAVLVDHRRHERQSEEARRRHVYRRACAEQSLADGAVRGAHQLAREDAQGPQGRQADVRAGPSNMTAAKAVLAAVGLKDGDYTMDRSTWASTSTS